MSFEHGPQLTDLDFAASEVDSSAHTEEQKDPKLPGLLRDTDLVIHDTDDLSVAKELLSTIGMSVREITLKRRHQVDKESFMPGLIILRITALNGEPLEAVPLERAQQALQFLRNNGLTTANIGHMFGESLSQPSQEL